MTDEERKEYGRGTATDYGYIVEWKLKEGSEAIADIHSKLGEPKKQWNHAGYEISELIGVKGNIVHPVISNRDKELSDHGLVRKNVAVAIYYCLLTYVIPNLIKHLDWRIVRIKLETEHKMTLDDNDKETEERMNEFHDMIEGMS